MRIKGIFLIDKPKGPTSHDVIDRLREITGVRKIGHAGTLDPKATGLLIIGISREYTKRLSQYVDHDKEYKAEIILGNVSNTLDTEGEIKKVSDKQPDHREVEKTIESFKGEYNQIPPKYSAKKIKGKEAYKLARKGKEIKLESEKITIKDIELIKYDYPKVKFITTVSSGTYIRSLARDIGEQLGIGAYLKNLRRTKIGKWEVKDAAEPNNIESVQDLKSARMD